MKKKLAIEELLKEHKERLLEKIDCPDGESLCAYVDGLTDETKTKMIEEHLKKCDLCKQEVKELLELSNALKDERFVFRECVCCKRVNTHKEKFCMYCGKELPSIVKLYCFSCGGEIRRESKYCPHCGKDLRKIDDNKVVKSVIENIEGEKVVKVK